MNRKVSIGIDFSALGFTPGCDQQPDEAIINQGSAGIDVIGLVLFCHVPKIHSAIHMALRG
jgi:hypothetical protein